MTAPVALRQRRAVKQKVPPNGAGFPVSAIKRSVTRRLFVQMFDDDDIGWHFDLFEL